MSDTVHEAICYRADGSLKWAIMLPGDTTLPPTTLEDGDTLWPRVVFGREKDGRGFHVPFGGPVKGPMPADEVAKLGAKRRG